VGYTTGTESNLVTARHSIFKGPLHNSTTPSTCVWSYISGSDAIDESMMIDYDNNAAEDGYSVSRNNRQLDRHGVIIICFDKSYSAKGIWSTILSRDYIEQYYM
jgi:hypothetical protein